MDCYGLRFFTRQAETPNRLGLTYHSRPLYLPVEMMLAKERVGRQM